MGDERFRALWLEDLRAQADDTVDLLRNPRTQERERRTCAAFLRCAGITFAEDQIQASPMEPPDVCFQTARFEITLSVTHQMDREWKERQKRRAEAKDIADLMEPYHPPESLSRQQVVDLAVAEAEKKAKKYAARGQTCATLDLLVYVNGNVMLNACTPPPACDVLSGHGWRSVSILIPAFSYVVVAAADAPDFLRERIEQPTAAWPNGQAGLFDI